MQKTCRSRYFLFIRKDSANWFRKSWQLIFVTLNRSLDVKGWVDLGYDRQVHDKKSFNINLLYILSLLIAFFKYSLLLFIAITHRIESHKILKHFRKKFQRKGELLFFSKENSSSCLKVMISRKQCRQRVTTLQSVKEI